jgi:glycosyltransferase involved in cell wall biosynthesis
MRILLVCHGLPPDSVGGVEQHVSGLSAALVAKGHEVEVFARRGGAGRQGEWVQAVAGNPTVWRVTYRWQGVDSLAAMYACEPMAAAMRQFLGARKADGATFDVAHVHHLTGMSVDSLDALAAAGVPAVLTLHDYWLMCPRGQMFHHREEACETVSVARCAPCLEATFPNWLDAANRDQHTAAVHERARRALGVATRLVVPSARVIPPFVALGVPRERFTVVENGVDLDRLAALPAPAAGPGPLRLGYFGTVMPSKGLAVLIAAVQQIETGLVQLHVHGNAVPYHGDRTYLGRCFEALRPGDGVAWFGPYGLDELPERMATIDVLAAPALWHEAFGLTVREALAAGRPALVARIGGLQDAVADRVEGRVLPPGDAGAWAAAIRELAADRGLVQRYAGAARRRARGFGAMADDLVAVYGAAAKSRA